MTCQTRRHLLQFYLPAARSREPVQALAARMRDEASVAELCSNQTWAAWTLQTYAWLRDAGMNCVLTDILPDTGIVLVARCDLPFDTRPRPRQLLACMVADSGSHPWAQVQIVQNRAQLTDVPGACYMPHWPQPGIVVRDAARGTACVNVAYFGHRDQLAPELQRPEWAAFLAELGMCWAPVFEDAPVKADYSTVDVVVALRSFDGRSYNGKPASKLVNAWRGGVPAILGPESAYRSERRSPLDYVEAETYADLCVAIQHLRQDPTVYARMREQAAVRAADITRDTMVLRWRRLVHEVLEPAYEHWNTTGILGRAAYGGRRYLALRGRGLRHRLGSRVQQAQRRALAL